MADRNHLKVADPADLLDDDPFAELTRIMGFDPREPVKPVAVKSRLGPVVQPAPARRAQEPAPLEDFLPEEQPAIEEPVAHEDVLDDLIEENDAAAEEEELVADFSIDLEKELMGELDFDEEAEDQHAEPAPAYAAAARYETYQPYEPDAAEDEQDDVELAAAPEPVVERWVEPADVVAFDPPAEPAPVIEPVARAPQPIVPDRFEEEFNNRFDAAFADVDMDFVVDPAAAPAQADIEEEDLLPAAYEAEEDEQPVAYSDEPVEDELEADAYREELQLADSDLAVEDEYDTDEPRAEAEDEYEAGSGSAAYAPQAVYHDIQPVAAAPVAAPPRPAARNEAEAFEFTLEDELNALLGNPGARSVPASPSYEAGRFDPSPVLAAEGFAWGEESSRAAGTDDDQADADAPQAYRAAGEADGDLDFDHAAFDAAIAKGFEGDDVDTNLEFGAEAPAEDASMSVTDRPGAKEDPLLAIAALTERYASPQRQGSYARANIVAPQVDDSSWVRPPERAVFRAPPPLEDVPDIETVEVADRAVALADDLDIPEVSYDEERPAVSAYDDLDSEFTGLLGEVNAAGQAQPRLAQQASSGVADEFVRDDRGFGHAAAAGAAAAVAAGAAQAAARPVFNETQNPAGYGYAVSPDDGRAPLQGQYAPAEYRYDPQLDDAIAVPGMDPAARQRPQRRGFMIAAIVGGVAVVGGIGAFALSFGEGGRGSIPVVVEADKSPIKVRPANPGGSTVPNQDNKVYDAVKGEGAATAPQQEKLVTTAEEPLDVTPPEPEDQIAAAEDESAMAAEAEAEAEAEDGDVAAAAEDQPAAAPAPKGEDRIAQMLQEDQGSTATEVAAVAPRKVRTMIVKPDGTLVPREDPEPAEAAAPAAPAAETAAATVRVISPDPATGTVSQTPAAAAPPQPAPAAAAPEVAAVQPPAQPAAAARQQQSSTTPDVAPIAPPRPAEQPVDVVGEVKADKVAAVAPAAVASGSWSMQIASQPSEAAAKSSYQDLVRRYGSVLNGHPASIVKAEIAGKGTFWRVRVPANSRNDAISLCESYKAAGGNCFVSR